MPDPKQLAFSARPAGSVIRAMAFLCCVLALPALACARDSGSTGPAQALPQNAGALLVEEAFSDPSVRTWDVYDDGETRARFDAGRFVLSVGVPDEIAWSLLQDSGAEFGDVALDVDATALGGPTDNSFGLVFRHRDRFNFYSFDISSDGYYRLQLREGTSGQDWQARKLIDWTPSTAIRAGLGQVNHLRLVAQGSNFTLGINGETVGTFTDATLARGRIGMSAGSFQEPGVEVVFDNLIVRNP